MGNRARPFVNLALSVAAVLLVQAVNSSDADARVTRTTTHRFEQIWSSSVRFVRLDQGYEILDKDRDTGFILFEFEEDNRKFRGSIEFIPGQDSQGNPNLRIVITLVDRPTYMEEVVIRRLMSKIRKEHGQAPAPRPRKPPERDKPKADDEEKPPPKPAPKQASAPAQPSPL